MTMTFIYVAYMPRMSPFPPHGPTLGAIITLLADVYKHKGLLQAFPTTSQSPGWGAEGGRQGRADLSRVLFGRKESSLITVH